jgi:hypothetical protein
MYESYMFYPELNSFFGEYLDTKKALFRADLESNDIFIREQTADIARIEKLIQPKLISPPVKTQRSIFGLGSKLKKIVDLP